MKFIHTADIHLDSPLIGLSAYADAPTELLRTATRDAFSNLVSEAIEEAVGFVHVAQPVHPLHRAVAQVDVHLAFLDFLLGKFGRCAGEGGEQEEEGGAVF